MLGLLHFIPRKGKGKYVLILPLVIVGFLFVICDAFTWDMKYIPAITLMGSSLILFVMEDGSKLTHEERMLRSLKESSLLFIKTKYWAIFLGCIGIILFCQEAFK